MLVAILGCLAAVLAVIVVIAIGARRKLDSIDKTLGVTRQVLRSIESLLFKLEGRL